ncbi:MAG: hypothetical protein CBE00_11490 [Planctomycetaceae bacterium TMED240]|nr:MAG: hypothetical protein CBE00_11490 [Planctomycetaceae bacterium TMED240]
MELIIGQSLLLTKDYSSARLESKSGLWTYKSCGLANLTKSAQRTNQHDNEDKITFHNTKKHNQLVTS